jgi:hypothetical protein
MSDQTSPRPEDSSGFTGQLVKRLRSKLANGAAQRRDEA